MRNQGHTGPTALSLFCFPIIDSQPKLLERTRSPTQMDGRNAEWVQQQQFKEFVLVLFVHTFFVIKFIV